jgi:transcription elongation factor GreA
MRRIPVTPRGYQLLREELRQIKEVTRPQIIQDIEEAISHGDLSENSEYDDAKHRQGMCEGRLREVESRLGAAEIIDITKIEPSDRVIFGVTVEVEDLDTEKIATYRIVGSDEADIKAGLLSITSPIARALIGKEEGDEVKVVTPRGVRSLVINDVQHK